MNNEVNTFPKGICPKVNVIERREFELAALTITPRRHADNIAIRLNTYLYNSRIMFNILYISHYFPHTTLPSQWGSKYTDCLPPLSAEG